MRKAAALLLAVLGTVALATTEVDVLAGEIARLSELVRNDTRSGEIWSDVKKGSGPLLARAESALRAGRRLLAMQRLAVARVNLEAGSRTAGVDPASFEARWKSEGAALNQPLRLSSIQPALFRALAEIAAPQVHTYYEASLEYGRSTAPENGLYYLATAHAQKSFVEFTRRISHPTPYPPVLRSLQNELDSVERELLAAYRPPLSIDKHPEFIVASSMVKEARELDAAGYRYGALLRYLEASRRIANIRGTELSRDEALRRVREFESRLAAERTDHSIARFFIEVADDDPAANAPAVAAVALPRYFAALAQAAPPAAKPKPNVTVTLVRWPYT